MCYTPFYRKDDPITPLPCGKCEKCLKRRASSWSFRLNRHAQQSTSGWFVTLTYDTSHVRFTKNGFMTLYKRDVQLFMKRLRKHDGGKNIRYYAVGEYGSSRYYGRPHYHLIIYNLRSSSKWIGRSPKGSDLYDVASVTKAWELGNASCGRVSEASCGYTLKYLSKPKTVPKHSNDDRCREFSLMSKRLGANYLTPQMVDWHKADLKERMYVPLPDGKKIAMPRYFKDKIYNDIERAEVAAHAKIRIAEEQAKEAEMFEDVQKMRDERALAAHRRMSKKPELTSTL